MDGTIGSASIRFSESNTDIGCAGATLEAGMTGAGAGCDGGAAGTEPPPLADPIKLKLEVPESRRGRRADESTIGAAGTAEALPTDIPANSSFSAAAGGA